MTILIEGGTVVTLGKENRIIYPGGVVVEGSNVIDIGPVEEMKIKYSSAESLDAREKIIMPSFINCHHRLYSTFARGLDIPGRLPNSFSEVLEALWWKLDRVLFQEAIYYSSLIPLMECARAGVTAIINHHESQSYQIGSLDEIKKAVDEMKMKAVLCLGSSDRFGKGERGIEENERFLRKDYTNVKGMVGLHASFTVGDETLNKSVKLADEFNVGINVNCAEDTGDQNKTKEKFSKSVVQRFQDAGVLGEKCILNHCVHLDENEMNMIRQNNCSVIHNPESNMCNAVGYSKIMDMISKGVNAGLGTDGISSDMLSQLRSAFLLARHEYKDTNIGLKEISDIFLNGNKKILNKVTGWNVGSISPGCTADIITIDYDAPTPLNNENFLNHLLFGIVYAPVDTTICSGNIVMRHKKITCIEEEEIYVRARKIAQKVWDRIS
ncbi:MAG: putative aminohydrolase SsnA [Elusimicrobiota bacterium]